MSVCYLFVARGVYRVVVCRASSATVTVRNEKPGVPGAPDQAVCVSGQPVAGKLMVAIGAVSTLDFTLQPGDGTVASGEHPVVAIQALFYKGSDSSKVAKSLLFNKADAVDATTTYNAAGLVRVPFTGVSAIVLESLGNEAQLRLGKRDSKTIISIMSCEVGGA